MRLAGSQTRICARLAARQALQQARRAVEGDDASGDLRGGATEFLRFAQRSIDQEALRAAWIALGRAETRLLTRVTTAPQGEQAVQGGAATPSGATFRAPPTPVPERRVQVSR